MRLLLDALADLVLPRSCAGCDAEGSALCPACRRLLLAARPALGRLGGVPVAAALPYDGAVRRLLVAHKERGALHLTPPLGAALAAAVGALGTAPVVLVPVPSAPRVVRSRGHDHARRLAGAAAARIPGCEVRPLLVHARRTRDQAGLGRAARAANLAGALRAPRATGLRVVVVDDVVTSGATAAEAVRALVAGGALVVGVASVAATPGRAQARGVEPLPLRRIGG